MAVGSKIISTDFNTIQKNISDVAGVGNPVINGTADPSYGYGQTVLSSQVAQNGSITYANWNNLRSDILKVRRHQIGTTFIGTLLPATSFTVAGVSVVAAGTYGATVALVSSTSGAGTGATFIVTKTSSNTTYVGNVTVTVVNGGSGYSVNDTITIRGGLLGGTDVTNNLTLTIADIILPITSGGIVTDNMATSLSTLSTLARTSRLAAYSTSFATVDKSVFSYSNMWTKNIVHTVNFTFADATALRYYFNSGAVFTVDAARTGGNNTTNKDTQWTNMLSSIGTVSFGRTTTVASGDNTGSAAFGVITLLGLSDVNKVLPQTIYTKEVTTTDAHSKCWITVQFDKDINNTPILNKLILKVNYDDDTATKPGVVVKGTLSSNVRIKYDNGKNGSIDTVDISTYVPSVTDDFFVYSQAGAAVVTAIGGDLSVTVRWPVISANQGLTVSYIVNFDLGVIDPTNPSGNADVITTLSEVTINIDSVAYIYKQFVATKYKNANLLPNTTYSASVVVDVAGVQSIATVASAATWQKITAPNIQKLELGGVTGSVRFSFTNTNAYLVSFYYQLSNDGVTWGTELSALDLAASTGAWSTDIITPSGGTTRYIKGYLKPGTGVQMTASDTTTLSGTSLAKFTPAPASITATGGNGTITFSATNPKSTSISVYYETSVDGTTWVAQTPQTALGSVAWNIVISNLGNNVTRWFRARYYDATTSYSDYSSTAGISGTSWDKLATPTITQAPGKNLVTFTFGFAANTFPVAATNYKLFYQISPTNTDTDWSAATDTPYAITTTTATSYSYQVTGLADNETRWARAHLVADNKVGSDTTSPPVSSTTYGTIPKPTSVTATGGNKTVTFKVTNTNAYAVNLYYKISTDTSTGSYPATATAYSGNPVEASATATYSTTTALDNEIRWTTVYFSQTNYNDSLWSDSVSGQSYQTFRRPAAPEVIYTTNDPKGTTITFKWQVPTFDSDPLNYYITSFDYYISSDPNTFPATATGTITAAAPGVDTQYTITGLSSGAIRYMKVIGKATGYNNSPQSLSSGPGYTTPAIPTFSATPFSEIGIYHLTLSWLAASGAVTYKIYTSTSGSVGTFSDVSNGGVSTTTATYTKTTSLTLALQEGNKYYFYLQSINPAGTSTASSTVNQQLATASTTGLKETDYGVAKTGTLAWADDYTYYTFTSLYGSGSYTFSLNAGIGSSLDPYLALYDGTTLLQFNDNYSGLGQNSYFTYSLSDAHSYTLKLSGAGGTAGGYSLKVDIPSPTKVTGESISAISATSVTFSFTPPAASVYTEFVPTITYNGSTYTGTGTSSPISVNVTGVVYNASAITSSSATIKTNNPKGTATTTNITKPAVTAIVSNTIQITQIKADSFTLSCTIPTGTYNVWYIVSIGSSTYTMPSSGALTLSGYTNAVGTVTSISIITANMFDSASSSPTSYPTPLAVTGVTMTLDLPNNKATFNYTLASGTTNNSGQYVSVTFTLASGGTSTLTAYSTAPTDTSIVMSNIPVSTAVSSTVPSVVAYNMFSSATGASIPNSTLADVGTITTSNISTSRITYSWAAVTNATKYKVTINTSVKTPVTTTSYDMSSGLAANTKYTIKLKAAALFYNDSVTEVTKDEYTLADPPGAISIGTVTSSSIAFTFGVSATRTSYNVYKDNALLSAYTGVTGTSVTAGSLSPNTQYTFKVSALNGATPAVENFNTAVSQYTLIAGVPSLGTPSNVTSTSATVNWTISPDNTGVTSYTVNYGTKSKTGIAANQTSYALPSADLTPGSTYSVTVVAICAGGSVSSAAGSVAIPLPTPVFSASTGKIKQVSFTWGGVSGAASYDVTFNGSTTNQTATSYNSVNTLSDATPYSISVVAKPTTGNPSLAGTSSATTYTYDSSRWTYVSTVERFASDQHMKITYVSVSGASYYANNLYLASDNSLVQGPITNSPDTNIVYTTKTGLSVNTKYKYSVYPVFDSITTYGATTTYYMYTAAGVATVAYSSIMYNGFTVTITGDGTSNTVYDFISETGGDTTLKSAVAAGAYAITWGGTAGTFSFRADSINSDTLVNPPGTGFAPTITTGTSKSLTIPGKFGGVVLTINVGAGGTVSSTAGGNGGAGGNTTVTSTASSTSATSFINFTIYGGGGGGGNRTAGAKAATTGVNTGTGVTAATFYAGSNGGTGGSSWSYGAAGGGAVNTTTAGGNGGTSSPGGKGATGVNFASSPITVGTGGAGGTSSNTSGSAGGALSGGGGAYSTSSVSGAGGAGGIGGGGGGSSGGGYLPGVGGAGIVYVKWLFSDGTSTTVSVTDTTQATSLTAANNVKQIEVWAVAGGGGGGQYNSTAAGGSNTTGGGGAGGAAAYAILS